MLAPPPPPPCPPIQIWIEPALPADWPPDGLGPLDAVTTQLPSADSLPARTWVGVRPSAGASGGGLWARLFRRSPGAHLALRCTALLARGYEQVGAGLDPEGREVAWGRVPEAAQGA